MSRENETDKTDKNGQDARDQGARQAREEAGLVQAVVHWIKRLFGRRT